MMKWPAIAAVFLFASGTFAADMEKAWTPANPLKGMTVDGTSRWIGRDPVRRPAAIVFLHPECPISNQYVAELHRLFERARKASVEFYGVISDPDLTRREAADFIKEYRIRYPVLFDASLELAERLAPIRVPEAYVLDADGGVAYRGRIDDQWAELGKRRPRVGGRELADAIDAAGAGKAPPVARTEVVGCLFEALAAPKAKDRSVTYARQIAPILRANCEGCHRPGEVAPFSLTSYADASKRAKMLAEAAWKGRMPPWKAAAGHGEFKGERRLSLREKELLSAWAAAGAPEGDAADLPPVPHYPVGWQLGTPDVVLEMPEPFSVPAEGPDIFQYFVLPIPITEDKAVVAAEFRPGNPRIVHHSVMFVDTSGLARKKDAADPGPGYKGFGSPGFRPSGVLGFWAPGYTPQFYPKGVGRMLSANNSDLAMQLHYHPSGKEETDRSMVGIYFAKEPIQRHADDFVIGTLNVNIPPGEARHKVATQLTLPVEVEVHAVTPHMHLIGKEMKVTATLPDGERRTVIWVDDWDFNWQEQYRFLEPLLLPAGTKIELEAFFDNSADNPANPRRPPQWVRFGLESTDEMCLFVFHTVADRPRGTSRAVAAAVGESLRRDLTPEALGNVLRILAQDQGLTLPRLLRDTAGIEFPDSDRRRPSPPKNAKP